MGGQTIPTFIPNNVGICWAKMLASFGQGFKQNDVSNYILKNYRTQHVVCVKCHSNVCSFPTVACPNSRLESMSCALKIFPCRQTACSSITYTVINTRARTGGGKFWKGMETEYTDVLPKRLQVLWKQ